MPTTASAAFLIGQGHAAEERGDLDAAQGCYRLAIAADSQSADAHMNLGNVLKARALLPAAIESYERALAIDPDHASTHYNLGLARLECNDAARAETHFDAAARLRQPFPQAWVGLALAQEAQGRIDSAIASYRMAVQLNPEYSEVYRNLGLIYRQQGQMQAALDCYRSALRISPDDAEVHLGLADALQECGEIDAAIGRYADALALNPNHPAALGNRLFTLNYHPDKSAEEIRLAYAEYDERLCVPLRASWRAHTNSRATQRRLRIGYVSPDFCHHPARHFVEPLLVHHDRSAVEVFAYAELSAEDAVTARYKASVEHWRPTSGMSDAVLADRIRADGIDILVDLAGHTARNRLGMFAMKPAPVSVTWLGFGYTTGLTAIDYILTDDQIAPRGSERLFAEQPWRMSATSFVYRPAEGMGPTGELPAIRQGFVTFGTLTRAIRINHRTIRVWAEVLGRCGGARLVVNSKTYIDAEMREALTERFAGHGIGAERLDLGAQTPPWNVLRGIDIGLDCFPHNSGTTLFETLYMGLPYVTLASRPSVGRLGSSILHGVGHPEWIAQTEAEYVERAVALASDLPRLAQLRAGLRAEMQASALMDEVGFARKVEAAYRAMFARWAGATPA